MPHHHLDINVNVAGIFCAPLGIAQLDR